MSTIAQHQQLESFYADTTLRQPVTMQQPETAKNVTVYVNGDKYNAGRRFVVNRKHVQNFDGFLTMVTNGLKPSFGAVRHIYTPNHGRKVTELGGINNGMAIVAGGSERFRKLAYQEISSPAARRLQTKPRVDPLIRPVYHSKMNVAARWKEVSRGPCNIYVYGNGDINGAAVRLLLIPRILKSWDMVLQEVTEKIAFKTGQACRRLYTIHGELVTGSDQLENGRYYVSVGSEKFKRLPYGERAQHMAMIASTRRPQHHLPPMGRRVHTNTGQQQSDSTYSQKYAARRQLEEDRSYQSHPPTVRKPAAHKRLRPIRPAGQPRPPPSSEAESSVFHAKPVKVKRSSATGQLTQVATDNEADVFRAKQRDFGAEEIADDDNTKVELPVDQVPADTVEDEENPDSSARNRDADKQQYREPSPQPKQTYAPRIEEDDSDLTAPSKTPTSARREETPPTTRSQPPEQKRNSVTQPTRQSVSPAKETELMIKTDAAIVIQSNYRGYRTRNALKSKRENEQKLDKQSANVENEEARQQSPTPELDLKSTVLPDDVSNPPLSHEDGATEEPREVDTVTIEPKRPKSGESTHEENLNDINERQASPENPVANQPLILAGDSNPDQDRSSQPTESPTTMVEKNDVRDTTPVVKSQHGTPDVEDQPDQPDQSAFSAEYSREPDDNDEVKKPSQADETTALSERDDGDGIDDEKHSNLPPIQDDGSSPDAARGEKVSARSRDLSPNGEADEQHNIKNTTSTESPITDGQTPVTEGTA